MSVGLKGFFKVADFISLVQFLKKEVGNIVTLDLQSECHAELQTGINHKKTKM